MRAALKTQLSDTPMAEEYRALARATIRVSPDHGVFHAQGYDPISLREAQARYRKRMLDEYTSTTVFSGLVAHLMEANATLDACAVVLRMAQDEFRHAELCGRVVRALGGSPHVMRETVVRPLALHAGSCVEERALRNVLVTSISEMHSVAYFVASLDRMTDPYLRSVTREMLSDEILHGRFGFYYLQAWEDWLRVRPEVRASISHYLSYVFAVCEREFAGDRPPRPRGADDNALGLVSMETAREVFSDTMEAAVAPGLERFGLDALRAWKQRSLQPN